MLPAGLDNKAADAAFVETRVIIAYYLRGDF